MNYKLVGLGMGAALVLGGSATAAYATAQAGAAPTSPPAVDAPAAPVGVHALPASAPVAFEDLPPVETAAGRQAKATEAPVRGQARVVVSTSTWCEPCGGAQALAPVLAAAKAHPDTVYDVLMTEPESTMRSLARQATATPNVRVRYVWNQASLRSLPEMMRGVVPSAVTVSTAGVPQSVALGGPAVNDLLAAR